MRVFSSLEEPKEGVDRIVLLDQLQGPRRKMDISCILFLIWIRRATYFVGGLFVLDIDARVGRRPEDCLATWCWRILPHGRAGEKCEV